MDPRGRGTRVNTMGSISRYIVRTTLGAFLLVLVSLTSVIWVAHILREFDLITNQGQTVIVFVGITGLLVPALVLVIAPLAFMLAVAHSLNKLNTDSEIIVMNASGMSPWRIFLPFLTVALIVSVLVAAISAYIAPKCLRELRTLLTKVRADLIANIVQPGRFTPLEGGRLTFHIRERRPNGELIGLFIDDRRDLTERATFLAERGQLVENETGTFLILEQGSVQRLEAKNRDPTIIQFERYAFDLTQFTGAGATPTFNVTERYIWDLINPDPEDPYYKANAPRFRTELHDRLVAPVYPLAFAVLTFAILGAPRTTRESRGLSMLLAIGLVTALRLSGFAGVVFGTRTPMAITIVYLGLVIAFGFGLLLISRGTIVEPPEWAVRGLSALQSRFGRPVQQT
jgi:lipopolysaccharide export system permease protein